MMLPFPQQTKKSLIFNAGVLFSLIFGGGFLITLILYGLTFVPVVTISPHVRLGILAIGTVLSAIIGIYSSGRDLLDEYRNLAIVRRVLGYLGDGAQVNHALRTQGPESTWFLLIHRSSDGGHQYRMTTSDLIVANPGPHCHIERRDPETGRIEENYLIPVHQSDRWNWSSPETIAAIVPQQSKTEKVRHYVGWPSEVDAKIGQARLLPWPHVILITLRPEGYFLVRYTEEAEYAGDTLHLTKEEAHDQAWYEYHVAEWKTIPPNIPDPVRFMLSKEAVA